MKKVVVAVIVLALGLAAYVYFHDREERKIKKQLTLLSECVSKEGGESAFALARRLERLGSLFAGEVHLNTPEFEAPATRTRREIVNLAARARMAFSRMTLTFHDPAVHIIDEGRAKVSCTGKLNAASAGGESVEEIREIELTLHKEMEGRWLFRSVEVVEVLKR